MEKKIGFFEEQQGVKSSTRLFSFILLIGFIAINAIYFMKCENLHTVDVNFIIFDLIILVGVFAPKYLHKIAESKVGQLNSK